jgi:hypothetical protein
MRRAISAGLLVLVGCGGGAVEGPGPGANGQPAEPIDEPDHGTSMPPSRALGLTATFGDLVSAARALEDAGAADASVGCLLRGSGPYRLEADLAVAMRPLPEAPADLDARLESARSVRLFSRWGQLGLGGDLAAAAFTTTAPPRGEHATAWVLTDRGLWILPVGEGPARAGPLALREAGARATGAAARGLVVVLAEAGVALADLRTVLAALAGTHANVALAVSLAAEVRLPAPTPASASNEGLCPDGLPELADGERGQLSAQAIVGSCATVQPAASKPLRAKPPPAAASSSRCASAPKAPSPTRASPRTGSATLACAPACSMPRARPHSPRRAHPDPSTQRCRSTCVPTDRSRKSRCANSRDAHPPSGTHGPIRETVSSIRFHVFGP